MRFAPLTVSEAIEAVLEGTDVFMIAKMSPDTCIRDMQNADSFLTIEEDPEEEEEDSEEEEEDSEEEEEDSEEEESEDTPEPTKKNKYDHQKIVNMWYEGRSIKYIAQAFNCNPGTIHYHLRKEGLV